MDLLEHGGSYPWSRCFMLPTETVLQLGPMIDATWYADIEYSERLTAAGWRIEARNGYWFTHLEAPRERTGSASTLTQLDFTNVNGAHTEIELQWN
jgi:hypothetical protein